jgi:hypothetical protein
MQLIRFHSNTGTLNLYYQLGFFRDKLLLVCLCLSVSLSVYVYVRETEKEREREREREREKRKSFIFTYVYMLSDQRKSQLHHFTIGFQKPGIWQW